MPGASGGAVLGDLANGALGMADRTDALCGSREGRWASKEGTRLSGDLSRDGREVEIDEAVGGRSNEGRGRIVGGGVILDDAWLVNDDGDGESLGAGGGRTGGSAN